MVQNPSVCYANKISTIPRSGGLPLKLSLPLVAAETRVDVTVIQGPEITLMAGADQLKQMLINLLRNAAEVQEHQSLERLCRSVSM